ncbi:metal-dependent hydrolase [Paenibacillus sp. GCM10027627]|uniref:metal-dependent hydrolase n=1 Tax=unclassified Paenibacillus TaxID=185978 RepID=UPI0036436BCB
MRGKTHMAIGAGVGAATAVYYSADLSDFAIFIGVAAFSALSADLDGPSMLSSKLTKLSRRIREIALWGGVLFAAVLIYFFITGQSISPLVAGGGIAAVLLGLTMKQGAIRNALVSLVGVYLIAQGIERELAWLIGLGAFVVWAPWLKHRGMTHTIWIIPFWWWLGLGLEEQLQLEGLAWAAALGYLSHLAADTLTPSGVKWLYPLINKSFKIKM